jgi:glc operon protein GlcG
MLLATPTTKEPRMNTKTQTATRHFLTTDAALAAIGIALKEAAAIGVSASVAIVGPALELIAFARAENATPHSAETSRRKAQTAASTRRATGWMQGGLAIELPMATGGLLTNVAGGVPIKITGNVVAGLGIAGGTVEQDAQIANAVLTALGVDAA